MKRGCDDDEPMYEVPAFSIGSYSVIDLAKEIEPRELPPRQFPFGFGVVIDAGNTVVRGQNRHRDTVRP